MAPPFSTMNRRRVAGGRGQVERESSGRTPPPAGRPAPVPAGGSTGAPGRRRRRRSGERQQAEPSRGAAVTRAFHASASWRSGWLARRCSACTPLGLWLYEDPRGDGVAGAARRRGRRAPRRCWWRSTCATPTTITLSTTRVELRLRAGRPADRAARPGQQRGRCRRGPPPWRCRSIPDRDATPARLQAFGSGIHRFAIEGRATFTTPVGKRKVRFAQDGRAGLRAAASLRQPSAPAGPDGSP